eukprot:1050557-Amphidinium_carterae.1
MVLFYADCETEEPARSASTRKNHHNSKYILIAAHSTALQVLGSTSMLQCTHPLGSVLHDIRTWQGSTCIN